MILLYDKPKVTNADERQIKTNEKRFSFDGIG